MLSLEAERSALLKKAGQARDLAQQAFRSAAAQNTANLELKRKYQADMGKLRQDLASGMSHQELTEITKLKRAIAGIDGWKESALDRIGSLEMDIRDEDGLLLSQIRECKSAVAAGDLGAFTIAGYTFQNEDAVLSMIEPLSGKHNYVCFLSLKELFSLCGDSVSSLSENMVLHKATKSAEFENTYIARVNTAHVLNIPSAFARKSSTGDAIKTVWNSGFKSYSAFAGGLKYGGKTSTERQLRKVLDMVRSQIRRTLPPREWPMQHSVASAMVEKAFLSCFDFLDAVSKFYFTMIAAGLPETAAWQNTQEFMLRVFEELEMVSSEAGEEDVDAGYIWSSMRIANKVDEFQRFRWGEHPCICSMLTFSILERLGDDKIAPSESVATEALEQCKANTTAIEELLVKQKKDHEVAANAVNQVKQLKEAWNEDKKKASSK